MRKHLLSVVLKCSRDSFLCVFQTYTNKMQGKYFLFVLMITFSQHIASSHILTSTNTDMSLPTCMKMLTYAVMDVLCHRYGAYSDYSSEEVNMPPVSSEVIVQKWEHRESLIKRCCTKPCSAAELMSLC